MILKIFPKFWGWVSRIRARYQWYKNFQATAIFGGVRNLDTFLDFEVRLVEFAQLVTVKRILDLGNF